jgi:nicotinamidase-related amidase
VDVVQSFLGPPPGQPLGPDDFMSCGVMGWERLPNIHRIIDMMREADVPIVFVKGSPMQKTFCGGSTTPTKDSDAARRIHSVGFAPGIEPRADEFVLEKSRPSAFFATPLTTYLTRIRADTILVAGTATSGCVRGTVVDSVANGYETFVIEDGCFDRSRFSHAVNLFEMQQKYANVVDMEELEKLLATLPARASDAD